MSEIHSVASVLNVHTYPTKVDGHAERILERMNGYMKNFKLCDVVLVSGVDGARISAHRLVLSAASDYFAAMFTGSLRAVQESEVILKDVQGDVLQNLIQHCYTGNIDLSQNTVETLLTTANLLQFDTVVETCIQFLISQMQPENCLGFALLAEQHCLKTLLEKTKSYVFQNFVEVSKNDEFFQLSFQKLSELLTSDDINASLEADVLKSLKSWVHYDLVTRDEQITELLKLVRLPLLEPDFIDAYLEEPCDSTKFQKLVKKALTWQVLQPIEPSFFNSNDCVKLRKSTIFGRHLLVFGNKCDSSTITTNSYCPRLNKWTVLEQFTLPVVKDFGVIVLNEQLLFVGGRNKSSDESNELLAFNLNEIVSNSKFENYITLKPMNSNRFGHAVAVLDGYLYAIGGRSNYAFLNTAERWDPSSNTWKNIAPLLTYRMYTGIGVLGGCLYVVGGYDGNEVLSAVECFDPDKNEWTFKKEMNKCRRKFDVVAAGGYLYAIGGDNDEDDFCATVERYDPSLNTWTLIPALTTSRNFLGSASIGNWIFGVGDESLLYEEAKKYDPNANVCLQIIDLTKKMCPEDFELTEYYIFSGVVVVEELIPKMPPQTNFVLSSCRS